MKSCNLILIIFCCVILSVSHVNAKDRINVTFVSCCLQKGFFWPKVEFFMNAAAEDLNIDLEVLYAQMDHLRMIAMAKAVATRKNPPDFLIIDNYKLMAGSMIDAVKATGIKVFVMANGLTEDQLSEFGKPREKYPDWIGELTPDNHYAGYQLAKRLIDHALAGGVKAKDGKLHLVAISGDYVTPAGLQRVDGLKEAVSGYPDVVLKQVVPGHWQKAVARKKSHNILARYPETGAIWAANDEMALGAMEGLIADGKIPGRHIFFGGVNWKKEALEKIVENSMVASVGGHFMIGAWSLILLHDYHWGKDFAEEGVRLRMKIFSMLDAENVSRYLSQFGDENWSKIDFTRFSKALNPNVVKYDFSLEALLRQ